MNAEGLDAFIRNHLLPVCYAILKEAEHHEEIKRQALGESLQVHPLEKLARYETHLDRKFERTLAILLKLKELRPAPLKNSRTLFDTQDCRTAA